MKTTFDLPEPLVRRAKAAAAEQGRPLRDLVAEAIDAKLTADAAARMQAPVHGWKAFAAGLRKLPDGTWHNPDGIEDEGFFQALEEIRREGRAWQPGDPFVAAASAPKTTVRRTRKRPST